MYLFKLMCSLPSSVDISAIILVLQDQQIGQIFSTKAYLGARSDAIVWKDRLSLQPRVLRHKVYDFLRVTSQVEPHIIAEI